MRKKDKITPQSARKIIHILLWITAGGNRKNGEAAEEVTKGPKKNKGGGCGSDSGPGATIYRKTLILTPWKPVLRVLMRTHENPQIGPSE